MQSMHEQADVRKLPTILALDPGGTTGYCAAIPFKPPIIEELGPGEHHEELWDLMREYKEAASDHHTAYVIVCERFEFRQEDSDRAKIDYMAAHYEGIVELFAKFATPALGKRGVDLVKQGSAQVKSKSKSGRPASFWADDAKIKKVGLWVPGKRHGMDAARHYLYYRTFTLNDDSYLQLLK